jgi:DNA polymerase
VTWGLEALVQLADEYEDCSACPLLCKSRTGVVFGGGNARADLMIIGEAPGAGEDEEGIPFVGKSGQLLMDMIRMCWPEHEVVFEDLKDIDEDDEYFEKLRDYLDDYIFWTNTTLCWPGDGNRTPNAKELKACRDRLHRTIYAVDPMLVIVAGKVAASALVGKNVGIVEKQGTLFDIKITSPSTGRGVRYPAMAILHPSFLLRKGDQTLVGRKKGHTWNTMEDLRYAFHLLDEQYQDIFGTSFPDRPREYKRE